MRITKHHVLAALVGPLFNVAGHAADPDCSGVERWATSSALVLLKNARLTDSEKLDHTKTKTTRLASERIGPNLFRQVHHVVFTERNGGMLEVITVNEASSEEYSMSGVQVFVVSRQLGGR